MGLKDRGTVAGAGGRRAARRAARRRRLAAHRTKRVARARTFPLLAAGGVDSTVRRCCSLAIRSPPALRSAYNRLVAALRATDCLDEYY